MRIRTTIWHKALDDLVEHLRSAFEFAFWMFRIRRAREGSECAREIYTFELSRRRFELTVVTFCMTRLCGNDGHGSRTSGTWNGWAINVTDWQLGVENDVEIGHL